MCGGAGGACEKKCHGEEAEDDFFDFHGDLSLLCAIFVSFCIKNLLFSQIYAILRKSTERVVFLTYAPLAVNRTGQGDVG
jgi:hypothetical protein